jgi:NNP family nitrate/nitrite transporter-like MFS transporter
MAAFPIIERWSPEDRGFQHADDRAVAMRDLCLSAAALTLACAVWMVWSVVVVHLPAAGFAYSTNQLFWLAALPALCGATLRLFYGFALPILGGRRFTALATASLLVPAVGMGLAVQDPGTQFEAMVVLALLCGLGGGNFASSMAHIGGFFPGTRQRRALALNAGLGHLGFALAQWLMPLVIGMDVFGAFGGPAQATPQGPMWLQNAGFVWVPLILAAAVAAWFGMNDAGNDTARFPDQAVIFTRPHTWPMCWLVLGSLGSFIGFAASLPLLAHSQFPQAEALQIVWLGPLIGAAFWPLGIALAKRVGGARVSLWAFVAMALGAAAALQCLPVGGPAVVARQGGNFAGFVAAFGVLFAAAGIANGGSSRMITSLFVAERLQRADALPSSQADAARRGHADAAAALGFASAIGAYGGFFVPKGYGTSLAFTGSPAAALQLFTVFYLSCIALTWWRYSRRNAPHPC